MEFDAWHIWLILTIVFIILEIFVPALIMSCIAFGSLLASIIAGFGGNFTLQIVFFSVGTLVALLAVRPMVLKYLYQQKETKTNVHALVGTIGKVTETINNSLDEGHVAVDGDVWKAISEDDSIIEMGLKVMITEVNSIILSVKSLNNKDSIKTYITSKNGNGSLQSDESVLQRTENGIENIIVSSGNQKIVCKISDIKCFFSENKTTFLCNTDNKKYVVDCSLSELEKKLSSTVFFRINRKFLITRDIITKMSNAKYGKLVLHFMLQDNNTEQVFVSRTKAHQFRMWFNKK